MSNLVKHAQRELELAGLFDEGSDYDGMLGPCVMKLVRAHSGNGHSGGSHWATIEIFNKVINYKTLTPISSDPAEWMEIGEDRYGLLYQNTRNGTCFSYDAGKTWYDIDDRKRRNWPGNSWYINLRNKIM